MSAKGLMFLFLVGFLGCAWGQEAGAPPKGNRMPPREGPRRGEMMGPMNWVGRLLSTDEFAKEVALTDEQKSAIKKAVEEIDTQSRSLQDQIGELARRQADLYSKTFFTADASAAEIYTIVEEIGKLRTEQAKLSVRQMVAIRDILTEEQRTKTSQYIREIGQKRLQERRQWENRPGWRNGMPPGGWGQRREGRPDKRDKDRPAQDRQPEQDQGQEKR